ncbi:hypothetical protein BpHYR1_041612 [Brachionus plicatilis]|uniref:Uncharacterized protein n=1 Tax=Brachionus plicatilis TaxID=10195 RepID=A0A3M7Q7Q5_BRAPC|nr:hypothetical protein BpHYR1_041612 [Brachionus plicatilis]
MNFFLSIVMKQSIIENHDEFEVFIDSEDDNCDKDKLSCNESEFDSDEKDEFDKSLIFDEDDCDNESKNCKQYCNLEHSKQRLCQNCNSSILFYTVDLIY